MTRMRLEDLPPHMQMQVLAQNIEAGQPVGADSPVGQGRMDRWGEALAGPWPGIRDGPVHLISWAVGLMVLALLFILLGAGYVLLAAISIVVPRGGQDGE